LQRGLEELGKTIALLASLALAAALIFLPIGTIFFLPLVATIAVMPLVGGSPLAATIVFMSSLFACSFFAGVYVAPHVHISEAIVALFPKK
jgi:hypothetical protein